MRKKERILYSTHRDTYTHNNRLVSINTTQYTETHTYICTTLTAIDGSTQHTHTHTHKHAHTHACSNRLVNTNTTHMDKIHDS